MQMDAITQIVTLATFVLLLVMFLGPPVVFAILYFADRRQDQHAVLRNFPILGRLRYLLEHVGPEFRQYLFDADLEGKPFSREGYRAIVVAGKYMKTLVSFGSKRDFDEPGWYVRNAMLPTLSRDMGVAIEPRIATKRYEIDDEGLFSRHEHLTGADVAPYTLSDPFALTLGADLARPWVLRGLIGMSAMSYGALGRHAIQAFSHGLARARGTWLNTGEGGSGATYQEMADSMGLPVAAAVVEADDALRRHGVRDRVKLFASGKLTSPDRIALALALGADAVAIARGLMISVGCIQAQRCHSNECPVGVATTDERLMRALVVEEKQWRVLNYVVTLRAALTSLAAAAGLHSPTEFERRHAIYRDAVGRIHGAEQLFPYPESMSSAS